MIFNLQKNFDAWVKKIAHKVFRYKNGFFEFPYQFTHPEVLVNSMKSFSFMKHDSIRQSISTKNPFFSGEFYYFEIEEGLWITIFNTFYKKNIAFINKNQIPISGYYNLSFIKFENDDKCEIMPQINNHAFRNSDWTLYQSGSEVNAYHTKNTKSLIANYTFDEAWLERNLNLSNLSEKHPLKVLFGTDFGYNPIIKNPVENAESQINSLFEAIKNTGENQTNKFLFKSKCQLMIAEFFDGLANNLTEINYCQQDKNLMAELLIYLEAHFYRKFPGIEELAIHLNSSPTKIKNLFKEWFGCSVGNWFRGKQMELAKKLLKEDKIRVQDVASRFAYASASKFTIAFKKHHGINPSGVD